MKTDTFILVADDDENDLDMITAGFARRGETRGVRTVRDGAEALDYLYARGAFENREPGQPDMVLLDLKMPRVDGWEVLRQVKGDEQLKLIPIVVFSSSARDSDVRQSYELGANAYVVKPIGYEQFMQAVGTIDTFWTDCNHPPLPQVLERKRP